MGKRTVFKNITAYLLLLAMVLATVPLHQVFHQHTDSTSYTTSNASDKAAFKTPEKPCCDTLQILPNGVLVNYYEVLNSVQETSYEIIFLAHQFSSKPNLFLNKAHPVVLA